ncbi:NAD-glutamate dehydrogenase [Phyllobacterium endophyticum]|uniref:NAD-glutamate dehydrogenase n=2 Tax=Phyllobacterium endophyticum TaxID=1149773 RepID=A0A2P7B2D0_9HYPH|nr:NAD-glutamate dehydrogenase [Phyllobacterium endophyticum]PSH60601.1 NAD-glutamate dehydrogenase [Phyllobacterium endophyticum]TYR42810.1 NAD-glutamate dehydrogenase [Phyllobacterium endophyticum]
MTRPDVKAAVKSKPPKAAREKKPKAGLFEELLFARAPEEDLAVYDSGALTASAKLAEDALSRFKSGQPLIDLSENNVIHRDGRPITVITLINDNMPFLLDSVLGEISERVTAVYLVLHPVMDIDRGKNSIIGAAGPEKPGPDVARVSVMQIHVPALDGHSREIMTAALTTVLKQVREAVNDRAAMVERLSDAIEAYKTGKTPLKKAAAAEAVEFLEWLRDNNFTFLGVREYDYQGDDSQGELERSGKRGLGILSDPDVRVLKRGNQGVTTTPQIIAFLTGPEPLIVTKANTKSLVHRRGYMDYIGVKTFDSNGKVAGELRFVGLFTSGAYTRSVLQIPYLRSKTEAVITRLGFNREDHSGKQLIKVLESYPRDDLFQIDVKTLTRNAEIILALGERPRVRVLPRVDPFGRFASIIVFVPRERYDSIVREKIGSHLAKVYEGHVSAFYPAFPEGALARVHFIIGHTGDDFPKVRREALEETVRAIVRTWEDAVAEVGDRTGRSEFTALAAAFPDSYRENFSPDEALVDASRIAGLSRNNPLYVDFYRHRTDGPNAASLKIYHYGSAVALSHRVPLLENMGFRVISEQTFQLPAVDGSSLFVHDMELVSSSGSAIDLADDGALFEDVFRFIWNGTSDNDGYNALALTGQLNARQIIILRAYGRYLQQAGIPYSQDFIAATLNRYPAIARQIFDLFEQRLNPARAGIQSERRQTMIRASIEQALQDVPSLDDDRILRRFLNLIESTLRTNAFAPEEDGAERVTLAFKLDPRELDALPEPRPYREIFVYGPEVEGVHLRFGPVARGGLRWSDRAQDYRTEVLGLVKAQQVKNAVIVPVGAKGGFFPKRLPVGTDRNAIFEAGRAAYITFISTLLSVTDNLHGETVVPPDNVLRLDGDDPYFVVAADKGTATFSDTANAISQAHDFWLDDAFASGGSAGYDHKKMGITARGAWEAVKRHFRELDKDIQKAPFTVVGVGDMSGDVFGNGMLLSPQTRLIAAFDHRDIFIDPEPDVKATLKERQRLFNLPRSSWQDFDRSRISKGGGVFSRSQKSITLSKDAAKAIGLAKTTATPLEIMTAILKAPVDLLWFGGIGTYIRSSLETDAEAGDRANDAIRITGSDVRAKVIGEGANLGMTQKARIEFGLLGGRCNSDAIDNSAGVNTSDVEVNIKIALAQAMRSGKLQRAERDVLLESMTEEVGDLVLRNNYLQTLALSLAQRRGVHDLAYQARFISDLEARKLLNRKVETLPDDKALAERQVEGIPLTRAELGVLLAYSKIVLSDQILASDLPDDPYLERELMEYFPRQMKEGFSEEIRTHRLRRDIIATQLANDVINRGGPTFVSRLSDLTGHSGPDIVRAYIVVRDGFEVDGIFAGIDALDNSISGEIQNGFYAKVARMLNWTTAWVLRNKTSAGGLGAAIAEIKTARDTLQPRLDKLLPASVTGIIREEAISNAALGAPPALAAQLARLEIAPIIPDIAAVAQQANVDTASAAKAYFDISEAFRIGRIEDAARGVSVADYYDGLALARATDLISQARRGIAVAALTKYGKGGGDPAKDWLASRGAHVDEVRQRMVNIVETGDLTVSRLAVAAGLLSDLS